MIAIRDRNGLNNKLGWLERINRSVRAIIFVIGSHLHLTYVLLLADFWMAMRCDILELLVVV